MNNEFEFLDLDFLAALGSHGGRFHFIKAIKETCNSTLKEAKDLTDSFFEQLDTLKGVSNVKITLNLTLDECNTLISAASVNDNIVEKIEKAYEFAQLDQVGAVSYGEWPCENSITSKCYYDHNDDPAHDSCVVCGEPEERL